MIPENIILGLMIYSVLYIAGFAIMLLIIAIKWILKNGS